MASSLLVIDLKALIAEKMRGLGPGARQLERIPSI